MSEQGSPGEPQWLSDEEQVAWRHFIRGTRQLLDRLERDLKCHGLAHDDYGLLVALSEAPDHQLRMAELAEQAVESRSRLSHHVGRLESKGLVRREACGDDRRGSFAVLTEAGEALMRETAPHHVAGVRAYFLDHVKAEELDAITAAFGRIEANFDPDACQGH
ncbi:MAG TPA: MarR family transcriptional regulator [Aquihabitans sp.]|jgi:DNA-binding MarR family transcriptional regulator|nr:MarR family transcriptional regulator [Aquihabitans sp.]